MRNCFTAQRGRQARSPPLPLAEELGEGLSPEPRRKGGELHVPTAREIEGASARLLASFQIC